MLMSLIALAAAQMAPPPATFQGPLQLTCVGAGTANREVSETIRTDKRSDKPFSTPTKDTTTTTTVSRTIQTEFADQVDVRLFMGDDRIRMPRAMVPELHGGNQGWFKLKNVVADARSIRAKIGVAFLVSPNLFIDRVTGIINISGKYGDYSGQCEPYDPNARPRF